MADLIEYNNMKTEFDKELEVILARKGAKVQTMPKERYNKLIKNVEWLKTMISKDTPIPEFSLLRKYDVINIDGVKTLIVPLSNRKKKELKFIVCMNDIFDVIRIVHLACHHANMTRMMEKMRKFKNITKVMIELYIRLCNQCKFKRAKFYKEHFDHFLNNYNKSDGDDVIDDDSICDDGKEILRKIWKMDVTLNLEKDTPKKSTQGKRRRRFKNVVLADYEDNQRPEKILISDKYLLKDKLTGGYLKPTVENEPDNPFEGDVGVITGITIEVKNENDTELDEKDILKKNIEHVIVKNEVEECVIKREFELDIVKEELDISYSWVSEEN